MIPGRGPEVKTPKKQDVAETVKSLGLDGVTRVVGRWGFQGKAMLTDVRVEALPLRAAACWRCSISPASARTDCRRSRRRRTPSWSARSIR